MIVLEILGLINAIYRSCKYKDLTLLYYKESIHYICDKIMWLKSLFRYVHVQNFRVLL